MRIKELPAYLQQNGPTLRWQLKTGTYEWQPTRKVRIKQNQGKIRTLSLPTVKERLILRTLLNPISSRWDKSFSPHSYGFRKNKDCKMAVEQALKYIASGLKFVVEIDLEKFFDRVPQNLVIELLRTKIDDKTLRLIQQALRVHCPGGTGIGQGSPLSPFLANLTLDLLDKELERRENSSVRYADDIKIFCRSQRAANRIKNNVTSFLQNKLKLPVNQDKSRVNLYTDCTILGFSITEDLKAVPSPKALQRLEEKIQRLDLDRWTSRKQLVREGWDRYYYGK